MKDKQSEIWWGPTIWNTYGGDEGTEQDQVLEGRLHFGIMLSTENETRQDFLEGRKDQDSGEGTCDYWIFALEHDEQM